MNEPLKMSFDVSCSVDHAFAVWTDGISNWWPPDHTVTGRDDVEIVLEGRVGGRIYERTPDGSEHDWGEVTEWDPPRRLVYLWHIGQDRANATTVAIGFQTQGSATTRVEIEHGGWERLGVPGAERRVQNRTGWEGLLPHFVAAAQKGDG
jgi:uncharacterized protein YndB with AHSA1/START domain